MMTRETRERYERIQTRVHEARKTLTAAQAKAREINVDDGPIDRDAIATAAGAVNAARAELIQAQDMERDLLTQMAGVVGGISSGVESFADRPGMAQELEQIAHGAGDFPVGTKMLGMAVSREGLIDRIRTGQIDPGMMADNSTGGTATISSLTDPSRASQYYGIVPQIRRRLQILAAIPTATMDGASIPWTAESGSLDFAAETAELTMKPAGVANYTPEGVVARTVAAWMKMPRQLIADLPTFQSTIQGRLTYAVLRRIENQIVAGNGVGQNLLGILTTPGIGSVPYSNSEATSDLALDGITEILTVDAQPDLAIMNPADLATMLKAKASTSGERLDSNGAFASTSTSTIWGIPAVASNAMPQGQILVGDFGLGATLFIREGVNARISDSDQDDFVNNRITCLAEARVALAVWQPSCFALVNLTSSSAEFTPSRSRSPKPKPGKPSSGDELADAEAA